MPQLLERVLFNYLKLLYICSDGSSGDVLGDVPGWPYCFKAEEENKLGEVSVVWSPFFHVKEEGFRVRFAGTDVLGEVRTVTFHASGKVCRREPKEIYESAKSLIREMCGGDLKP